MEFLTKTIASIIFILTTCFYASGETIILDAHLTGPIAKAEDYRGIPEIYIFDKENSIKLRLNSFGEDTLQKVHDVLANGSDLFEIKSKQEIDDSLKATKELIR